MLLQFVTDLRAVSGLRYFELPLLEAVGATGHILLCHAQLAELERHLLRRLVGQTDPDGLVVAALVGPVLHGLPLPLPDLEALELVHSPGSDL